MRMNENKSKHVSIKIQEDSKAKAKNKMKRRGFVITLHYLYDFIYKAKLRTHVVAQENNENSLTITYDTIVSIVLPEN